MIVTTKQSLKQAKVSYGHQSLSVSFIHVAQDSKRNIYFYMYIKFPDKES